MAKINLMIFAEGVSFKNMKKRFFAALCVILPLLVVLGAYFSVPSTITIAENSEYNAYPNPFVTLASENITADEVPDTVQLKLFGTMPIRTIDVDVVPEEYVIVSGKTIGVRIYSDGIMAVKTQNNSAAKVAGIKTGDIITEINHEKAVSTEQFSETVRRGKPMVLTVLRDNNIFYTDIIPKKQKNGSYSIGLWVRDSGAGIGTLCFQNPDTLAYGALGHAICDSDTADIIPLLRGTVSDCKISAIRPGTIEETGELIGSIGNDIIGTVDINGEVGLYGILRDKTDGTPMPIAHRYQVKSGSAQILCDINGEGVKSYEIEIAGITSFGDKGNKSMKIKITDKTLLEATGGIVQGMSGSPIIQNGRIVGAVTHVFVNDPTRGYGIFIENMLAEAEKIK